MRSIVHFDFMTFVEFAELNSVGVSLKPQGKRWNLFVHDEFVLESVQRKVGKATLRWDVFERLVASRSKGLSLQIGNGLVQFTIPSGVKDEPYKSLVYTTPSREILEFFTRETFRKVLVRDFATA